MNKELFILTDYLDLKAINFPQLGKCDRLAMTPGAMLAFEQNKLSYLSFNDFYDYKQFRSDNTTLINATEELFYKLDRKYERFLNYPRAFTGNIYWFLHFFSNIYYISRTCGEINRIYDKVYFGDSLACQVPLKVDLGLSSGGVTFGRFSAGLDNKVKMMGVYLSSKCISLSTTYHKQAALDINKHQIAYFLKRAPIKILSLYKQFIQRLMYRKKGVIFVIQDDYEVSLLKEHMPQFLYINPIDKLLQMAKGNETDGSNLDPLFGDELKEFIKNWFPVFEKYVFELFALYHNKVLSRLNFFSKYMKNMLKRNKPNALFYSNCAHRVYEDLCAYLANQNNIPIFYFQHGGTISFFKYIYEKYMEQNKNIKKTVIYASKVEKELYEDNVSSIDQAPGSIKLFNLYGTHNKRKMSREKHIRKSVLYCTCPFSFHSPNVLMFNVSDRELFEIDKDIIDVVDKFKLKLDIKTHPGAVETTHLEGLLTERKSRNINILKGFPIEGVIGDYGLLILNHITSALVSVALVFDIPTIIYARNESDLRKETISDFKSRFYLVKNKDELERYITLFDRGKLESKLSLDIINKYAFPINSGNPCINISKYIQKEICV